MKIQNIVNNIKDDLYNLDMLAEREKGKTIDHNDIKALLDIRDTCQNIANRTEHLIGEYNE